VDNKGSRTLYEAKELIENADKEKMRSTALNGYRLFSTAVVYGGVKQRWIVVFSEKAFVREKKTPGKNSKIFYIALVSKDIPLRYKT
jgi:transposase